MADIRDKLQHWIEIDLDKLAANLQTTAARLREQTPGLGLIAVVKNDAYGFGAVQCAEALLQAGADMLAVTTLEEALELREAGLPRLAAAPVLVFFPPQAAELELFAQYQLTATVDSLHTAQLLQGWPQLDCHLKLNTGMNRFGLEPGEELAAVLQLWAQPEMPSLGGVYSHLATALEQDEAFARRQIKLFAEAKAQILAADLGPVNAAKEQICWHLANSAGSLRYPEAHFSAVRLGSVLYGQLGLAKKLGLALQEPFSAKARIAAVRDLPKGAGVGYSQEFTAKQNMRLAVVPYGYGDGFGVTASARELTIKDSVQEMSRNVGKLMLGRYQRGVYYQGQLLPALGRVAMQSMMVDIGKLPLQVGDVVEAPMRRTSASCRLPRVYLRGGQAVECRCLLSRILSDDGSVPKKA